MIKATTGDNFTLPKYRHLHNRDTMPTAPPYSFSEAYEMQDPVTLVKKMEKLPVYAGSGWVHFAMAKVYAHEKMAEFGSDVIQFEVTWPAGDKNWLSFDRGDFYKVW